MRLRAAFVAIVAVALLAAGLRSAEGSNSGSFTDPAGDQEPGSPDVTGITIANDDSGLVTVRIQFAASPSLGAGMRVGVLYDTDANSGTGAPTHAGAEYAMQLDVGGNQWAYYRWNGSAFEHVTSTTGSIVFDSTSATVRINRSELAGTSTMNFYVFGDYSNDGVNYYTDWAPAQGGSWQYNIIVATTTTTTTAPTPTTPTPTTPTPTTPTPTTPTPTTPTATVASVDSDRDGVLDKADACPKTKRGRYDSNKNGCPGPFRAIKHPTGDDLRPTKTVNDITTYEPPRHVIDQLPPGAQVTLRYRADSERLRADKAGRVKSRLLLRNGFPNLAAVEIRAWKPGWVGYSVRLVVLTDDPFAKVVNRRCIPPTGPATPRPCNRVSRGR